MSGSTSGSVSGSSSATGSGSGDRSTSISMPTLPSGAVESYSDRNAPTDLFTGTGIDIVWEHVTAKVQIATSRGCCKGSDVNERTILDDVSGAAPHGSVTFLMGPSGSGKTTTLNLLAGRAGANIERTGTVTLNGVEATDEQFKGLASFVTQDDILFNELTPYEQVLFTARMHLGGVSDDERKRRVLDVLTFLGLNKCKDTVIGTPGLQRGISGGERKRVNIANSLITNPEILVLDEPTSGLDSETALSVIQLLCRLAKEGKTVLATLHQPSVEMLDLCDNLVLLSAGRVAYSGPYAALPAFFEDLGYDFPERRNPMDIAMNIITPSRFKDQDQEHERIDAVVAAATAAHSEASAAKSASSGSASGLPALPEQPSVLSRTAYLFARSLKVQAQSRVLTRARAAQTVILGLVVGAIFWQLERGATGGSDRLGLLFLATINQFIVSLMGVIGTLPKERPVALREITSGSYSASMYFFSKAQADVPFQILFPGGFATIIYWMAGLKNDAEAYWIYIAAVIVTANIGSSLGFFVSSMTGDTTVALAIAPATILPMLIFSGYLVRVHRIPGFLRWISYINPFRYTLSMLTQNELRGLVFSCPELPGGCLVKTGQQLLTTQDLEFISIWKAGVILVAFFVAFRILGLLAMNLAVRRHRKSG